MKKKIFKQQKVIKQNALDLYIPVSSAKTFGGVYYYMHGRFALYYQECLRRNLLPSIRGAFFYHGFSAVDASKVLKLVIGFSQKRSMQFKGPLDFSGDFADSAVDYSGPFTQEQGPRAPPTQAPVRAPSESVRAWSKSGRSLSESSSP